MTDFNLLHAFAPLLGGVQHKGDGQIRAEERLAEKREANKKIPHHGNPVTRQVLRAMERTEDKKGWRDRRRRRAERRKAAKAAERMAA
ncbi:MAG: hypothetical protein NXI16_01395 [Alphaproteobacteria bacterium]|nr:hypothetical protein [Alphaproteobacteria bacterium]